MQFYSKFPFVLKLTQTLACAKRNKKVNGHSNVILFDTARNSNTELFTQALRFLGYSGASILGASKVSGGSKVLEMNTTRIISS